MQTEVSFTTTYTVSIAGPTISPDPVSLVDNGFINLVVLKAACILVTSEYRTASAKGLSVKDGPSSIDGRQVATSKGALAGDMCKKYEDAKKAYQAGDRSAGQAIVGPYNIGYSDYIRG